MGLLGTLSLSLSSSLYLYLSLFVSLYLSLILLTHCQDHILTENIWFVWSWTSYSGDKWRCYRCGTYGRTNKRTREDRATQPMDAGWLSFAIFRFLDPKFMICQSERLERKSGLSLDNGRLWWRSGHLVVWWLVGCHLILGTSSSHLVGKPSQPLGSPPICTTPQIALRWCSCSAAKRAQFCAEQQSCVCFCLWAQGAVSQCGVTTVCHQITHSPSFFPPLHSKGLLFRPALPGKV